MNNELSTQPTSATVILDLICNLVVNKKLPAISGNFSFDGLFGYLKLSYSDSFRISSHNKQLPEIVILNLIQNPAVNKKLNYA